MKQVVITIDIGGTWMKGSIYECSTLKQIINSSEFSFFPPVQKVKSRLSFDTTVETFVHALDELLSLLLTTEMKVCGVGISTAGVVSYAGDEIEFVAPHLSPLKNNEWICWLKEKLNVPVILINDSDAVTIGASVLGYLKGDISIGIMPIGTGLGFTVWRNGRRVRPNFSYTLLGCISTATGDYDQMASVVNFAKKHPKEDLISLFTEDGYAKVVDGYINGLVNIIQTSYYLYHTKEILIGGGLADIVRITGFPLENKLNSLLQEKPLLDGTIQRVSVLQEGNHLPLLGAAMLAYGETMAYKKRQIKAYNTFETEKAYGPTLHLEQMSNLELSNLLWKAEQDAGISLANSLDKLPEVIEKMVYSLENSGRIIYAGAGTSGRLAAMDTVEIACTFGLPRDRILTLIAGGVTDAAFDIEANFEEDASSISEMLMTAVNNKDIVIGITASGSAYYVQSALAYAKSIGAYSVLIQEEPVENLPFCDTIIPLYSGPEVVAGSTRLKAGTATKKILNILSTIAMIRLGKVHGSYMTHVECINQKLKLRAQNILQTLYNKTHEESATLLEKHNYSLKETILYLTMND